MKKEWRILGRTFNHLEWMRIKLGDEEESKLALKIFEQIGVFPQAKAIFGRKGIAIWEDEKWQQLASLLKRKIELFHRYGDEDWYTYVETYYSEPTISFLVRTLRRKLRRICYHIPLRIRIAFAPLFRIFLGAPIWRGK